MSILINGMAMPQSCRECRFMDTVYRSDGCRHICIAYLNEIPDPKERLDTCPLAELPNHEVDKVCYICPHCNAILFVDKAKEVSGFKWCPNCGTKMHHGLLQEETVCTDTKLPVAWNEEWTRQ